MRDELADLRIVGRDRALRRLGSARRRRAAALPRGLGGRLTCGLLRRCLLGGHARSRYAASLWRARAHLLAREAVRVGTDTREDAIDVDVDFAAHEVAAQRRDVANEELVCGGMRDDVDGLREV